MISSLIQRPKCQRWSPFPDHQLIWFTTWMLIQDAVPSCMGHSGNKENLYIYYTYSILCYIYPTSPAPPDSFNLRVFWDGTSTSDFHHHKLSASPSKHIPRRCCLRPTPLDDPFFEGSTNKQQNVHMAIFEGFPSYFPWNNAKHANLWNVLITFPLIFCAWSLGPGFL